MALLLSKLDKKDEGSLIDSETLEEIFKIIIVNLGMSLYLNSRHEKLKTSQITSKGKATVSHYPSTLETRTKRGQKNPK